MAHTDALPEARTRRRALLGVAAASIAAAAAGTALKTGKAEAAGAMTYGADNASPATPEGVRTALYTSLAGAGLFVPNANGAATATGITGVVGGSTASTLTGAAAVFGETGVNAVDSSGVHGLASGVSDGVGIWGQANGTNGVGVRARGGSAGTGIEVAGTLLSGSTGLKIAGLQSGTGIDIAITNDEATGVKIVSDLLGTGVDAFVPDGVGVQGKSNSQTKSGVRGENAIGAGMFGTSMSGQGVVGEVTGGGVGLCGLDSSNGSGTALQIIGKSDFQGPGKFTGQVEAESFTGKSGGAPKFPTAGLATVPKGKASVKVTNASAKPTAKILVTPQSNPGSASVKYVKKATGSFEIFLSENAGQAMKVAWFILA